MSELRSSIVIDLTGNLQRRAKQYERSIQSFSRGSERSLRRLSLAGGAIGRSIDRIGNRYTALLAGVAGIGAAQQVIGLEERLTRLGITADISDEKIKRLKEDIFATAQAPDIRVDPSEILSAVEDIIEKTGDLDFALKNLRNIGLTIGATGAAGGDIGAVMAEIEKQGVKDPAKVLRIMDTLNLQGKAGAFTLQNLARLGPRVITAYTSTGRSGVKAMQELGAALQVVRMGTGNAEQAATAFEAVVRTMTDPVKLRKLQAGGIQVFEPEALKEGKEILRPINQLMTEIIQKTGAKKSVLGTIFDAESIRAFNQIAGEFIRTGKINSLEKFMQVQGTGASLMHDSARAANTAAAALTNLNTAWKEFANSELTQPIEQAADALNSLDRETMQKGFNTLKVASIGLGALYIGRKLGAGRLLGRLFGGRSATGKLLGAAGKTGSGAAGLLGVQKVFVVNMPSGGLAAGGLAGSGAGGAARQAGKLARFGRVAGGIAVAGVAGYEFGKHVVNPLVEGTKTGDAIGSAIAHTLAFFGNDEAQAAVRRMEQANQVNGTIHVQIESAGRARVTRLESSNKKVALDVGHTTVMP